MRRNEGGRNGMRRRRKRGEYVGREED